MILLGMAMTATAGFGDWLITLEGRLIETDGPWTVEDDTIVYTDTEGETREIARDAVDLEASRETTALKSGKPYVPPDPSAESEDDLRRPEAILYVGWRCGPCEEARNLLDRLGVAYVERYDEQRATRKELRKKVGRRYILPVIDFYGKVVTGYRPLEIRRIVRELEDERDGSEDSAAGDAGDDDESGGEEGGV